MNQFMDDLQRLTEDAERLGATRTWSEVLRLVDAEARKEESRVAQLDPAIVGREQHVYAAEVLRRLQRELGRRRG